jgi:hypothetical protein
LICGTHIAREIVAGDFVRFHLNFHVVFTDLASSAIATYTRIAQPFSICRPGRIRRTDNNSREASMVHTASGASFSVSNSKRKLTRPKLTWLGAANLAAISVLAAAPDAHARITKIQILTRGTAFGGHFFAVVGQYEFITGIATGEVDPNSSQNPLITDIQLAPKNAQGHVVYSHNFHILQPLDPSKGNHKMMYEPPNRGGKTYQTLNNTPTGTNDPAALTDATVLDDWPRSIS